MYKKKVLFVCSMGRLRSRTAAHSLLQYDRDYGGTDKDADKPITQEMVDWAEVIVCMEKHHRNKLTKKFKECFNKIQIWNIPDEYEYMDDTLLTILRGKAERNL